MKVKIVMLVVLSGFAVSTALAQGTSGSNAQQSGTTEIQGGGTPNYIAKFTGSRKVGNSALFENGPNLITYDNFSAAGMNATVDGPLSVAMHGSNNTTDGSTDPEAFNYSGLVGVLGVTMSPASVALEGIAFATVGDPMGVLGRAQSNDRGIGVRGQSVGNAGDGIGVLGEVFSSAGHAGVFNHQASSGYPISLLAYSASPDGGEGIHGRTLATTGLGIGVNGDTSSFDGFGGSFTNFAGGNILRGVNNTTVVFRVDGSGTVFANGGLQPGGADFAESIAVTGERNQYQPGDLLVIDDLGDRRVKLADRSYSPLVAGIYSTKPGVLASPYTMDDSNLAREVPLAIVGIVPCKVSAENGPIAVGDLLVTSSTPGYAMKGTDRSRMLGAVVGKALEPLREGKNVIQVLVTLQ